MPVRIQQQRTPGWRKTAGAMSVTRPGPFANPFPVVRKDDPAAHAAAVARYREWILSPERAALLAQARRELRGLDLMCSCKPDLSCHADVLLELVNRD